MRTEWTPPRPLLMRRKRRVLAAAAGCALLAAGCSEIPEKVEQTYQDTTAEARQAFNRAYDRERYQPETIKSVDTVSSLEGIWLGDTSIKRDRGEPLPPKYEMANGITIISARPVNLDEIATQISDLTGIPVRMDDLMLEDGTGGGGGESSAAAPAATSLGSGPGLDPNSPESQGFGGREESVQFGQSMKVSYAGPLSGLLNIVSSRFNIWWRYKNGAIDLYNRETRTFTIHAPPEPLQSLGAASGGGGGGGGDTAGGTDVWATMTDTITSLMPEGHDIIASPATGTITVTTTPQAIKRIAKHVREQNTLLTKQVALNVMILKVRFTNSRQVSIDWTAAWDKWKHQLEDLLGAGIALDTPFRPVTDGAGLINMNVVDLSAVGQLPVSEAGPTAAAIGGLPFFAHPGTAPGTGSGAIPFNTDGADDIYRSFDAGGIMLDMLSTQGKTSLVTTATLTTMNNRLTPIRVNTTEAYVESVTVETTEFGQTRNENIGDAVTGTLMDVRPRVLEHGRIMVGLSLGYFETNTDKKSGDTVLPITEERSFVQELVMKSGETLVMSGFETDTASLTGQGVDEPGVSFLGGQDAAEGARETMVVLLTPHLLVSPTENETRMSMQ